MEKVSQEQINEWKAKYGEIVKITVKDEVNGDKCCYLHKPSRKTLSYASVAGKNDAQLRYYMHIPDPDSLTDEEWAARFRELEYIRREEAKVIRG